MTKPPKAPKASSTVKAKRPLAELDGNIQKKKKPKLIEGSFKSSTTAGVACGGGGAVCSSASLTLASKSGTSGGALKADNALVNEDPLALDAASSADHSIHPFTLFHDRFQEIHGNAAAPVTAESDRSSRMSYISKKVARWKIDNNCEKVNYKKFFEQNPNLCAFISHDGPFTFQKNEDIRAISRLVPNFVHIERAKMAVEAATTPSEKVMARKK